MRKDLGGLPWTATTREGFGLNYPDPLMEQFMWAVSDVITLSREITFCGGPAIIAYSDNDRGHFELGIKKNVGQARKKVCSINMPDQLDDFLIAEEQSTWYVSKRYPARPAASELKSDIEKLMLIAKKKIRASDY